jgi:protease-4
MILFRLIGLFLDLLLLPLRLLARHRVAPPGAWLTVTIDGPVVDVVGRARFWWLRAQKSLSLHALDAAVTVMSGDPRVKGLLVTLRSMSGGMASASSLRGILARARASGKTVAVHLPMGGDPKEVYVASVANTVLLGPTAQLAPLGFRSAARYMKRALDHAGVEPQVFTCGEFKSAGETLVRDAMSPAQRAQLERLIEAFHGALVDGIVEGRSVSRERAVALVDEGPYFGQAAIDAGLADQLAYDDEVRTRLDPEQGTRRAARFVEVAGYVARMKRPLFRRLFRGPVVAVVRVHGTITHAGGSVWGGLSTDERVIRTVRAVRRDRRVRGVILHVDSPGGSALASDRMHHEIAQLGRDKPLVVCMANIAASGGYYVAAPAACIVAQPTTVTGSIGVVAARVSLEPLLSRLGITTEVVAKGARSGLLSGMGPLDDDARAALARELDAMYRSFVAVVADGREMSPEAAERLARGRVYTGKDAHDVGLVDVLGGFDVALAELRKLLDARIRDRVEVVIARTPRGPVPPLDPPRKEDAARKAATAMLSSLLPDRERRLIELAATGERVLALAPITET